MTEIKQLTEEKAREMLETVIDPELGVDIVSLGLIYNLEISEKNITVTMTFTTPSCPSGPEIKEEVEESLKLLGFESVKIVLTFDPPWQPSPELREALGV